MKVGIKNLWRILIFMGVLLFCLPCSAQNPAQEHIGDFGTVDWIGQKISATGLGVASADIQNPAQARAMAKRAAVVVARRNLLEVVKGIRIDSKTTVVDYAVKDDTIVSNIKGVLNYSTVDKYEYLPTGAISATVSMSFTGTLGEILTRVAAQSSEKPVETTSVPDMQQRIRELEARVQVLENKLGGLRKLSFKQDQTILLFKQFMKAWSDYIAGGPYITRIDYDSDKQLSLLQQKLNQQASYVTELSNRMDDMAGRLALLESKPKTVQKDKIINAGADVSYTGLVIDARHTDFRPCLKPEIFGESKRLYPGEYVNMQEAIRYGYVRYYRKIERAQQSARSGSLPYIVKAQGTFNGKSALAIGAKESDVLKTIIGKNENFLANCHVVIVF